MDDFNLEISIPTDDDGFVLLCCPKCGELFKLPPSDIESDEVMDIHCPLCGLISENYITEDVIELVKAKSINKLLGNFYKDLKSLERRNKSSLINNKTNKPKLEDEIPIRSTIDSMEIVDFKCCKRQGKIRHLLNYCGCYCPYCGGIQNGSK